MRYQAATEYIILIGTILAILIPVLYYFSYQSSNVLNLNDAQDAVQSIAKTADYVYSLGPGTKSTVLITIPKGVINSSVEKNEVALKTNQHGDVIATTKANLTGGFPYLEGTYNIQVTLLDTGIVLIGGSCNNNDICEYSEDCSSCPNDCGCSSENCCSGLCVIPQCNLNSQCNDNNACTTNLCKNPGTCLASCTYTEISSCINGDGCCPSGCNINNDNDCSAGNQTQEIICGDGLCVAGETCYSCALDCVCGQEPPFPEGGTSLKDLGVDQTMATDTGNNGLNTRDSQMSSSVNITLDLLDDTLTTPSSSYVIRTNGNKYESFSPSVERDSSQYTKIVLYGRVRTVDVDNFRLRIYPYLQDKDSINTNVYADFVINDDILNQKVKWVELDITNIVKTEDGFGFIKIRVTSLTSSNQDNKRFQFSELHYKVG